jgi:hypothetical protein
LSNIGEGVNSVVSVKGTAAVLTGVKDEVGFTAMALDRTPPRLRLLGSGTPAITPTGEACLVQDAAWSGRSNAG